MKSVIAIRAMIPPSAIRVMKPIVVIRAIHPEDFHSENFSMVSNWRVVAMMVAVHRVMKSASAIRVMKPDNAILTMEVAIRVTKLLNAIRATIVVHPSADICSTNHVGT
jgi:hypothetical protein